MLIVDRDALARNALRNALTDEGLCVVGQAGDESHAASLAKRCAPNVVIVDATLPADGGLSLLDALQVAAPRAHTILLGSGDDDDTGLLAISRGASGYLSRGIELRSLAEAVRGAVAGEAAVSRAMAGRLVARVQELSEGLAGMRPIKSSLTPREWEVLALLKAGRSTTQIAEALSLSPDTVHSHVRHILRKLDVHSRAEAIEVAERGDV